MRSLFGTILLLMCASSTMGCVSHLSRYDEPARVEAVALGKDATTPDLVLLDVVWSYKPKDQRLLLLVVPPGPDPRLALLDTENEQLLKREATFLRHKTERWTAQRRADASLAVPADLPPAQQRSYGVRNVFDEDRRITLEITRENGGKTETVGRLPLPPEFTPADVAPVWRYVAYVPFAVIDVGWIAVCAVCVPLAIPLGGGPEVRDAFDPDLR